MKTLTINRLWDLYGLNKIYGSEPNKILILEEQEKRIQEKIKEGKKHLQLYHIGL